MEVRILGPLAVTSEGQRVEVTGAKERGLLVLLALQAGRVVSSDRLVEDLWEGAPPQSGVTALRVVVSRLRKALGGAGGAIVTRSRGYLLDVASVEVDATRFEALAVRGRSHLDDGLPDQAAAVLRDAIALWRSEHVADAPGSLGRTEAARLDESRLSAIEARIEADLARGAHASLIGELEALTAMHRLRECLWHARIVALYRCGRQAEALRSYQQLRVTLADELGIDPSVELRRLEEAVLAQDPALDHPAASLRGNDDRPPTGVVTFLLTDIVDSTALWDDAPGAMERALEQHDDIIRATVASHGGQLIKSKGEGDSSLSVFRRASSAATAATELQRRMTDAVWPAGLTLQVRAAIHTGEAQERDGDYYGSAVIRAARLRSLARGGQVLVSSATFELAQDVLPDGVELRSVGRRELRGLRRDEHVFELALPWQPGASPAWVSDVDDREHGVPPALASRLGAFFVGRDEPLARLVGHWSAADGGQRRVVFIGGEPGIGKTRLTAELARHVADRGGKVIFGRCEEGIEAPYQPFIEALRSLYEAGPTPEPRVASHLVRLVPELGDRVRGLPAIPRSTPEAERYALFEAVAEALDQRATDRPLLLVLDDMQWATDSTALMLRHLLTPTGVNRLMIVATYRDTEVGHASALGALLADVPRMPGTERVSLAGLDVEGVRAYLAASGRPGPSGGSAALHARTGGNPFFVGATVARLDDHDSRPPTEVSELIGRRVDVLSQRTRGLLAAAAVAGERFELRVLQQLSEFGDVDSLLDALDEATAGGLVRDEGGTFAFGHALIREAILDAITPSRRARLHRRIGEAIEALPDANRRTDQLAHHFVSAAADGDTDKGVAYCLAASRVALAQLAPEVAARHAERGLSLVDAAPTDDPELRFDLLMALTDAGHPLLFGARGGLPIDRPRLWRAVELARSLHDRDRLYAAALRLGVASQLGVSNDASAQNELADIGALYDEVLSGLGVDDVARKSTLLARLAQLEASLAYDTDPRSRADEALLMATASGDPTAIAEARAAQRAVLVLAGSPDLRRVLEVCDDSVSAAASVGPLQSLPLALYDRFAMLMRLGDRSGAEADAHQLRSLGSPGMLAIFEVALAAVDGRFTDADRLIDASRGEQWGARENRSARNYFAALRFDMDRERGTLADRVPALVAATVNRTDDLALHAALALACVEVDDLEAARVELHRADELISTGERRPYVLPDLCRLAEVSVVTNERSFVELLMKSLEPFAGQLGGIGFGVTLVGAVDRYLGMLSEFAGDHAAAADYFNAAVALEEGLRSPPLLARTRHWYGRFLIERSTDRAVELLSQSLEGANELGMTKLAADSRSLLAT